MNKWLAIMFIGVVVGMFTPLGIKEYVEGQCKVAAIQAKLTANEIIKVCE